MYEQCPRATQHGDTVCRNGMLWALTYSDSAPPDQRTCVGPCNWPGHASNGVTHCCDGEQAQPAPRDKAWWKERARADWEDQ